jgi:dipeptidyl aminopeptidase/acylaminoacyl peptidase
VLVVGGAIAAVLAGAASAGGPVSDGGLIAFDRIVPPIQIYLVHSDGQGLRPLHTGVSPAYEPEWSPDGRWLCFRGGPEDDLYLIRPDGSGLRRLTRDSAHEQSPAWSPDGRIIVYERWSGTGSSSIYTISVHGRRVTRLTRGANNDDQEPSWSPDGSQIAFVRQSPKSGFDNELWLMNTDGSHQHQIFPLLTGASDPVWAPDGKRLLITDGQRLYIVSLPSGQAHAITTLHTSTVGETEEPAPEWSPSGTKIIFNQLNRHPHQAGSDIWIINADGTGLRRLTPASGPAHPNNDPSWQPLRTHRRLSAHAATGMTPHGPPFAFGGLASHGLYSIVIATDGSVRATGDGGLTRLGVPHLAPSQLAALNRSITHAHFGSLPSSTRCVGATPATTTWIRVGSKKVTVAGTCLTAYQRLFTTFVKATHLTLSG